jgi:hypothetical protein
MKRAYAISILLLVVLTGFLADRDPSTSAELLPIASAIGWVEGSGRALEPELLGAGIKPAHVVKIGTSLIPRTPPAMMLFYGGVCRLYKDAVGRPLQGTDIPMLSWLINFLGVLPWALILFAALRRLAILWGMDEGAEPEMAAWAVMAGSLAFGWLGVISPYLPVAAIACWIVVIVLEAGIAPRRRWMILAGLMSGLAGAAHPAGWIWGVWGILLLFVSSPKGISPARQTLLVIYYAVSAAAGVVVCLIGNALFFGTPLPIQWIDIQPLNLDMNYLVGLIWHDLIGWNGLLWLSPLILPGVARIAGGNSDLVGGSAMMLLIALAAVALFSWGIAADARLLEEMDRVPQEIRVIPVELSEGEFVMVQLGPAGQSTAEQRGFFERLVERTDIFFWTGGRSPGMPMFLPVALILSMLGWSLMGTSRFWDSWNWVAVRFGGLLGLFMSQAPYGSVSELFVYLGLLPSNGHVPIAEAVLAVCTKLSELWPSGVVQF